MELGIFVSSATGCVAIVFDSEHFEGPSETFAQGTHKAPLQMHPSPQDHTQPCPTGCEAAVAAYIEALPATVFKQCALVCVCVWGYMPNAALCIVATPRRGRVPGGGSCSIPALRRLAHTFGGNLVLGDVEDAIFAVEKCRRGRTWFLRECEHPCGSEDCRGLPGSPFPREGCLGKCAVFLVMFPALQTQSARKAGNVTKTSAHFRRHPSRGNGLPGRSRKHVTEEVPEVPIFSFFARNACRTALI
jgi:hypothetical protein